MWCLVVQARDHFLKLVFSSLAAKSVIVVVVVDAPDAPYCRTGSPPAHTTSATNLTKDRRSIFFRGNHLQRHFLGRIYEHQTFPKISEAVDASWRGWRAPRRVTGWRGCTRASLRFSTRHTTTRTDRSALQVRLRALSVPSDRNRSPRGRPRGCYHGGSGSGEAVEALGRSEGIR